MRRNRPPKDARQRAAERGWIFRPLNPMPTLILRAAEQHRMQRLARTFQLRMARIEQRPHRSDPSKPATPITDDTRVYNYVRQGGARRPLTPRQQRRRVHKANAHAMPCAEALRQARASLAR